MNHHSGLGKLELKSAPSKASLYFAIVLLIVFTAICCFIYWGAIIPIHEGKVTFAGDISIFYKAMGGIMAFAILIFALAFHRVKGTTFYLYEQGIVAALKGNEKCTRFTEIQDIYLFTTGRSLFNSANNVAYRCDEKEDWQVISVIHSNARKAIQLIRSQHKAVYVPKVLQQLSANKGVSFHYIKFAQLAGKRIFALNINSYLNVNPESIMCYNDRLVIGTETIYLCDIQQFSVNNWTSQINLYDKENESVFSISFVSVFSGDSFIALLDELVNKK